MVLVNQYRGMHGGSPGMTAEIDNCAQRVPLIQDVIDDQHVAIDEGNLGLGLPEQLTSAGLVAVTGRMQVGQLEREVQLRHQLAGEDQPTVHDAEHHRVALGQFSVDGFGNLGDSRFDLFLGVQAVCLGHDLADMCEIDGHEAIPPEI